MPPHPISPRSILIFFTYPRLGLPSCLFPSDFPTNNLYASFFSKIIAKCSAYFILPYLIILIILCEDCKLRSSSICSFLHPPVTSSLLSPNILFSKQFSNTLSLCSSLKLKDQIARTCRTTSRIIVLCILILTFLGRRRKCEGFWTEW
jgi:hypothetical protein